MEMTYKRKTVDEWEIIGHYPTGPEVVTTDTTFREHRENLKLYRENERETRFTGRVRRVPISHGA